MAINFDAKILLVDGDPQCNLTQYVLGEEEAFKIYNSDDPNSIYNVIRPLSLGKGYGTELPILKSENFHCDIIIGDPRLALQEDLLAQDWRDAKSGGMRGLLTTFVFLDLLNKAKSKNYDFVFFDMGPSLGAISRSILLAVDYFVVPMSIDIFSLWAIKNIGSTVGIWQKEIRTGLSLSENPTELPFSHGKNLQFVGYVTQQHKERGGYEDETDEATGLSKKRIVEAYKNIGDNFPSEVSKSLGSFYSKSDINPHLGDIRHLGSLAPKSQSQHEPMISVRATGSYTSLRKQAREIYRSIAARYLENLANAQ